MKEGLVDAFSSLIASSSVEQLLIELKWDASINLMVDEKNLLQGCELIASKADAFRIFGIPTSDKILSWDPFRSALLADRSKHGGSILYAIEDAVRSALSTGPVDNEQFFVSSEGDMYRILIARHYSYYDGSRHINMYLIPMLKSLLKSTSFDRPCPPQCGGSL